MIIESVAAASATLSAINGLIKQANEAGTGMQQLMGTISEFGEALDEFEVQRRNSTFKGLNQSELLRLQMIRKSYERHWRDVNDLLAMFDPELHADFRRAKAEQEQRRQEHMRMLARKRKERQELLEGLAVAFMTILIGGFLLTFGVWLWLGEYF